MDAVGQACMQSADSAVRTIGTYLPFRLAQVSSVPRCQEYQGVTNFTLIHHPRVLRVLGSKLP